MNSFDILSESTAGCTLPARRETEPEERAIRVRNSGLVWSIGSACFLFGSRAGAVIYQLRFAVHAFGASFAGLIALLNQVTFYILLAELGLAAATTSLMFEPVHAGDHGRVKALVLALEIDVRRIVAWLGPVSLVAAVALSLALSKQVPLVPLSLSLLLTCAAALLTFLALPYQSHLNASDRVPVRNLVLGTGFALKVLVGIALAKLMHSFVGLPLGTALVGVPEFLVQRQLVIPRLGSAPAASVEEARAAIRGRAKFVLAHRIGYLFSYQSDYIILLLSASLPLLGYYAQYQYLYAGLLSFALAVGGTLTAKVARRQLSLGRERFPSLYRRTSLLVAAGAVLCGSGFYLLAGPAVHLLYRTTHIDSLAVLLFAVLLMLNILKMNDDIWIDTTGAYRTGYYLPILEALTYVGLGLLLVHDFRMPGILLAGIAVNLLFSVACKSVVLGTGVMRREVLSTSWSKALSLGGMAAVFGAIVLLRWVRLGHAF